MRNTFVSSNFGTVLAVWLPCVVFAHIFAGYYLFRTFSLLYPKAWLALTRPFRRTPRAGQHGAAGPAVAINMVKLSSFASGSQPVTRKQSGVARQLSLEWFDVGCSYAAAQGTKVVLQGVTGAVLPGEMMALMGPSGAGKSTLMDILAYRKTQGDITGRVLVNGAPREKKRFVRETAYIPQDDNFLPTMTVAETASYYAALTLPRHWGPGRRQERIEAVLAALGLSHTAQTMVGGYLPGGLGLRGLSGGERKRLSIATGILATPSIVFLDEPTSGLDSFAALKIMGHLRSMSQLGGPSVVASIHQPRAAIWSMFDSATLLSKGHLMYSGPREGVVPWFEHLGYPYDPAMHGLPSDWIMDLVNIDFDRPQEHYGPMFYTEQELESAAMAFGLYTQAQNQAGAYNAAAPLQQLVLEADAPRVPLQRDLSGVVPAAKPKVRGAALGAAVTEEDGGVGGREKDQDVEFGTPASSTAAFDTAPSSFAGGQPSPHSSPQRQVLLDQLSRVQEHLQREVAAAAVSIHGAASGSSSGLSTAAGVAGASINSSGSSGSGELQPRGSWGRQVRVLFWRELLAVTRNPADVAGRMLIFCWLGVFIGLIFFNLSSTIDGLRSRLNVLFLQPVLFLLLPYVYMSLFGADKQYFIADASAKLYRPSAYYIAKQLAVFPFMTLNVLVFSWTLYGLAGLRHSVTSLVMNGVISVLLYAVAAQVLACAAIVAPNQDLAFMGAISWTAINMLFSNIMVRYSDFAQYWISYLRYISAMGYAFAGYAQLEFRGLSVSCETGVTASVVATLPRFLPTVSLLRTPFVQNALRNPGPGCKVELATIVDYFGVTYPVWMVVVILTGYLLLVHLATFLGLLRLAKKERR